MSSNHTLFTKLALLLAMIGALALAGCGGDDNGLSAEDMARIEMAEASAAEAMAAQMAAEAEAAAEEAARMAAEAEATQAAADKAAAEAAEAAALALQMEAEEDQAAAEAKAAAAEAAAQMAQDAAAEAAMTAKEAADLLAEVREDLAAAEQARMDAEMDQMEAEMGQTAAEMERDALAAADTATRAASIIASMETFISDVNVDNAARASGAIAALDVTATALDYDPDRVTDTVRDAIETATEDDNLDDPMMSMYGDEAVGVSGTSGYLARDVSQGQKNRPSGVNTPALGGVSLKYADGEITAAASPPRGDEFAVVGYEAQDAEPPAIAGWDGGVLMRRDDVDNADQMLYYYTDIAEATGVSFLQKYRGTSAGVTNGNIARASSLTFPNTVNPNSLTLTGDDSTTADTNEAHVPFAGTFDGVEGTFTCMGRCVVSYSAVDGSLSLLFGAVDAATTVPDATNFITFTPNDFTDSVAGINNEHLVFGYWLHKPSNPAAAHHFMPFASGMAAFDVRGDNPATTTTVERDDATRAVAAADPTSEISLVHLLTGTARFKGPAAGKYVTREVLGQSAMIGQFTATAELLADFDSGTAVGGQLPGAVTGVVQDFMDANGDPLSNWHVTLGSASLMAIGADPGINEGTMRDPTVLSDNSFNGRTEAGMSITQFNAATTARLGGATIGGTGRWVGQFYGPGRSDGKPNAIVGVFDAHAGHASISGAFGSYNTAQ